MKPTPPPHLWMLQAARADVAVIFRRGPTKWVEVVRWDTRRDQFERGAWFHGQIYPCDLSPDGELLLYYARRYRPERQLEDGYTNVWTAISRPPWLTALALWPIAKGDYSGGGLFLPTGALWLNHSPEAAKPHPRHKPHGLRIEVEAGQSVYERRLDRDHWRIEQIRPQIRVRYPNRRDTAFRVTKQLNASGSRARESFTVEGPSGVVALP